MEQRGGYSITLRHKLQVHKECVAYGDSAHQYSVDAFLFRIVSCVRLATDEKMIFSVSHGKKDPFLGCGVNFN